MTTTVSGLAEFLLARIAEDEAVAREGGPELAEYGGGVGSALNYDSEYDDVTAQPARILAECEAKRRIVEDATQGGDCQGHPGSYQPHGEYGPGYCRDFSDNQYLRLLALPYADHPDYSEEWRP